MRRLLLFLGGLAVTGCLNTTGPSNDPSDPATETFASGLHVDIATMQKTEHGVYYRDVIVGSGPALTSAQTVIATYAGYLKNAAVFDAETQVQVDLSTAPFGLQEGMLGMRVGGERLIVIPSELGYGNEIVNGIPPNSTLVFDIELDEIP